jgi:hypothetical protein
MRRQATAGSGKTLGLSLIISFAPIALVLTDTFGPQIAEILQL